VYDCSGTGTQVRLETSDAGGISLPSAKEVAACSDITFIILLAPEHIEENTFEWTGLFRPAS
jgi:3-hydroxyisobutyrate dehydrogenase-like beta-hydroxyacid dehydrogenase